MDTYPEILAPSAPQETTPSRIRSLVTLFKLRVVALLFFAAVAGASLGAGRWPGAGPLAVLLLAGGLTWAPATQAHFGAPYPVLLEQTVGPYIVSALADPDVGRDVYCAGHAGGGKAGAG